MMTSGWQRLPADEQTEVLVVGAGLAGLSTAMFLAQRGIDVLVVERHPNTSLHPRATGQHPRTMELFRVAGIDQAVLDAGYGLDKGLAIRIAESLHGPVLHTVIENLNEHDTSAISPAPWGMATQDVVEPIMRARAEKFGAQIRFSTELVAFEQDADGVSARLLNRWTEQLCTVRAAYLVAADGHRSPVRERLGITRPGAGTLGNLVGVLFEAELRQPVEDGAAVVYHLRNPEFTGVFAGTPVQDRYIFGCEYHPELGESLTDFTHDRLVGLIRVALDDPDLEPHILGVQAWEMAARVAERFRAGRVFLAGDAAKVTPPTGGLGGNTAVGDGFDLAWKLAAVLRGEAGPGLLDSYAEERRPFAEQVVNRSLHNARERAFPRLDIGGLPEPLDYYPLVFGLRNRSNAVLIDDDDPALTEDPYRPSGRPGFRAPHVRLACEGDEVSTVDLFGESWVLLTADAGSAWPAAAIEVAEELGISVVPYGLGPDMVEVSAGELAARYGIGERGASLVRPDGVVAWRCDHLADDPEGELRADLTRLLDR